MFGKHTLARIDRDQSRGGRAGGLWMTLMLVIWMLPWPALGALDLSEARVDRLPNGLTLILLEDHGFPAVSVQMLYRAGARNEDYGVTGLAHFLEHMAFRASENFPDTDMVSRIYAAGGEWHGYTWIDQTTFFETVPVAELDTALRIEADRMMRLKIPADKLEPERGAVLSEMHGYENNPASRLHDQLVFVSILGHPYRNNVIGLESDVRKIQLEDIRSFYRANYHPGNAVLAIVGDFDTQAVLERVQTLFGGFPTRKSTPLPRTVEPIQQGLRRVTLRGPGSRKLFEIAYHAPSARHEDFAAFLVLQEILGGSGGVNFKQDNSVTPVAKGSLLDGVAQDLRTWFPPSADSYVFTIAGSIDPDQNPERLEQALESRISGLRETPVGAQRLSLAIANLHRQLVFDLETTEDAAHQLAYFDGLGALDVLLGLERSVSGVTAEQVRLAARRYLQPTQRSIGWYLPGEKGQSLPPSGQAPLVYGPAHRPSGHAQTAPASVALIRKLSGGLPVILQRAPASPAIHARLLYQGEHWEASAGSLSPGDPDSGVSSLQRRFLATQLKSGLDALQADMTLLQAQISSPGESGGDPGTRLENLLQTAVKQSGAPSSPGPLAIVIAGDLDEAQVMAQLEERFGRLQPSRWQPGAAPRVSGHRLDAWMEHPIAQAQLGYAVPAPPLASADAGPWQALLYILSHGYEGRLGKQAISNRGLVYYIDSRYRSDRDAGWISLAIGVDPDKFDAMQALLQEQLQGLLTHPPSQAEVNDARSYLRGRYITRYQSNEERTARLARQWLQFGSIPASDRVLRTIDAITRDRVLAIVPAFVAGSMVSVRYRDEEHPGE